MPIISVEMAVVLLKVAAYFWKWLVMFCDWLAVLAISGSD